VADIAVAEEETLVAAIGRAKVSIGVDADRP